MEYKDYYQIMGVARGASQAEIKRAYRELARKHHPDVSKEPNAEALFKELGEAYEVLKDPEKRAAYDRLGANWKSGQEFHPPPGWNEGFPGGGFTGDASDFSDFFETIFGRGAGPRRKSRRTFHAHGEDRHAQVTIDLEDAWTGPTRTITLQVPEVDAQGRVSMRERKINVKIPHGIRAGQNIRLAGQGGPSTGKGHPGDLYLEVAFRPHPLYRVEQHDVYLDLPVSPWEAALGASVKVPTPGGTVELKVPAGSEAGSTLRLKGRGIPGDPPGEFYVVLHIALPPADTEAATAFYRKMAEQFGAFDPRARWGVRA